jgi:hypothetical protein
MANAMSMPPGSGGQSFNGGATGVMPSAGGVDWSKLMQGGANVAGAMSANSGAPYGAASDAYNDVFSRYMQQMQGNMSPYMQAGQQALPMQFDAYGNANNAIGQAGGAYGNAGNALSKMSNSQDYIANILNGYQESPAAQMERKYGMQGMGNAASASGMLGSGAMMKSAADYNQQLTNRDMQQYLENNMGVNREYLSGQMGLGQGYLGMGQGYMGLGQGYGEMGRMGLSAGTSLNDILSRMGMAQAENAGGAAYGQEAGGQQDWGNMISGLFDFGKNFIPGGGMIPSFGGR